MSGLERKMRRAKGQRNDDYTQPHRLNHDGSYFVYHPTKGWRFISAARIRAQNMVAHLLDHFAAPRRKTPRKQWREPAPVPPGTETRQQRRWAARKGPAQ